MVKNIQEKISPSNGRLRVYMVVNKIHYQYHKYRVDAKVGQLYVFPYTLLHGVYPFNGTDEIRRTMSFNCNLYKPAVVQQVRDQQIKEADNA